MEKLNLAYVEKRISIDSTFGSSTFCTTTYNTKGGLNSYNWNVSFQSIIKDYTDSGNCDKTARSVYAKYMYKIMKLESKT